MEGAKSQALGGYVRDHWLGGISDSSCYVCTMKRGEAEAETRHSLEEEADWTFREGTRKMEGDPDTNDT